MSAVFDLKERLSQMGVAPKKAFGQNFLVNAHVIGKIIDAVQFQKIENIIEIGPGLGALTEPLLAAALKPKLIEFDPDLAKYWQTRGLEVHYADALKFDWESLGLKSPALLVSNLPYQISSSLVIERCLGPTAITYMVLMFQKEVAQRLQAQPMSKEYGLLSVMAQLHYKITRVVDAGPGDFFPAPKISSRVLAFQRLDRPTAGVGLLKFLKQGFAFRRKFLLKNLKSIGDKSRVARLPAIFEELGLSAKARAEELTPEQLETLYKKTYEH